MKSKFEKYASDRDREIGQCIGIHVKMTRKSQTVIYLKVSDLLNMLMI